MSIKGLLKRGRSSDDEDEEPGYFMSALVIDDSLWSDNAVNQAFRAKLVALFAAPKLSVTLDAISTLLNMSIIVIYILYLDAIHDFTDDIETNKTGMMYFYFLRASHTFFMVDLVIRLITSKNPRSFILSIHFLIEIVTIIPFLFIGFNSKDITGESIRFCMMLDTLRGVLCKRIFDNLDNVPIFVDVNLKDYRESWSYLLLLITAVVFPTAIITYLETLSSYPEMVNASGTDNSFWINMYFILYTCSVVGYGAALENPYSFPAITLYIIFSLYLLPNIFADLLSKMGSQSQWARAKYEKQNEEEDHIVLLGEISDSSLTNFLQEYFNEDHAGEGRQCVIVRNCVPSH